MRISTAIRSAGNAAATRLYSNKSLGVRALGWFSATSSPTMKVPRAILGLNAHADRIN